MIPRKTFKTCSHSGTPTVDHLAALAASYRAEYLRILCNQLDPNKDESTDNWGWGRGGGVYSTVNSVELQSRNLYGAGISAWPCVLDGPDIITPSEREIFSLVSRYVFSENILSENHKLPRMFYNLRKAKFFLDDRCIHVQLSIEAYLINSPRFSEVVQAGI